MPKYYVQSGNVRTVISAEDAERAALWVIHRTMQQVLPVYDEEETCHDTEALQIIDDLAPTTNRLHPDSLNLVDQESQLPLTATVATNTALLDSPAPTSDANQPGSGTKILRLGATLKLSEEGFDRPDAQELDCLKLVCQWNQLMVALERLQSML